MTANAHEFTCTGPVRTEIEVGSGTILVTAAEGLTASVRVDPEDGRESSRSAAANTSVEFDRDRLTIHTPRNEGWGIFRGSGNIRVEVRLPLDSSLAVKMGSADLRTTGGLGDIDVKTGSGDVLIAESTAGVRVHTGSGDVRVDRVGGDLSVRTGSGDVNAARVAGALSVNGASGDVRIDDALGVVRLTTASGDVNIGAVRGPDLHVNSASGDVTVGVPTGTKVWLDLSTMSGSTSNDLEMTGQPAADGPTVSLQVRTMSGDIRIRRAAA